MAVAIASTAKISISHPYHMATNQRQLQRPNGTSTPLPVSPSCSTQPSTSNISPTEESPEPPVKAFRRLRSSLEQSLRTATRSSKVKATSGITDEFANVMKGKKGKEKERPATEDVTKGKKILRRLESRVTFGRSGRESVTPTPPSPEPPPAGKTKDGGRKRKISENGHLNAFANFISPSMRQATMSSPALHLSSQALPSPKSQSAVPASSSSPNSALVSPHRSRPDNAQHTTHDISGPAPLTPRRDSSRGHVKVSSKESSSKTRPKPPPLATTSTTSLPLTNRVLSRSPMTPTRRSHDPPSSPETPTPVSRSRSQLSSTSTKRMAASSTGHLPLHSPTHSPTPRASTPAQSSTRKTSSPTTPSHRLNSSSTSYLPMTPSRASPSPTPKRPSIDTRRPSMGGPRRLSFDSPGRPSFDGTRRPSMETPRKSSLDSPRRSSDSPTPRGGSPSSVRPRGTSPSPGSFAQNRYFNISTTSLSTPSNPELRALIRNAMSLVCKELVRPPPHLARTETGVRDWEEVEVRIRALARLEKIWGNGTGIGSSTKLSAMTSSSGAEERERQLFGEALRDGYVLCQLMNKLCSASVIRADCREDGFIRTSNVTKFLAACSNYGVPAEDLFHRDDLIEATPDSLGRVARTVVALVKHAESPSIDPSKYLSGQAKNRGSPTEPRSGPYSQGGSRAATSTPNLNIAQLQRSTSPVRKRWSPPSDLPTVRSRANSPGSSSCSEDKEARNEIDTEHHDTPRRNEREAPPPPPKSPLRFRPPTERPDDDVFVDSPTSGAPERISVANSTSATVGDSVRESLVDPTARQSMASSNMTETTVISSFSDPRTSSNGPNKFGTIRTVTTEATSDAPSFTRTEGIAVANDIGRKRGTEQSFSRERKPSETAAVDLSRVTEEVEETGAKNFSTRTANGRAMGKASNIQEVSENVKPEKMHAIRLGKGKWPDDFLGALQSNSPTRPIPIPSKPRSSDQEDGYSASPKSTPPSGPRKLAIVGASRKNESESVESLHQFPRRPKHLSRHSIDTTVPSTLFPRDASPDAIPSRTQGVRRRSSSKPRNGLLPQSGLDDPRSHGNGGSPVPFPRSVSCNRGLKSSSPPPPDSPRGSESPLFSNVRPRGRFQSDIEGVNSRRRPRPTSYDELGSKPRRSRYESMVNLGGPSGHTSASDLMSRDSLDGSAVRRTLILRDEGKPPTHFQLGNCIGRGQFGSVYRALNLNTGQMVAVKRIRLEGLKEEEVTQLMREVELVKSLSHPSIVKYEGMARDEDTLNIVLEYAENGSLGQTLKAFGKLNERLVAGYVVRILEGLHYLHRSEVVHCDLKAANILTTKNGNVKLSDFGVSLNLRAMEREIKDVAGTPNWMAPEVIELKGASTKSDIWSLACTVIELLTGRPPYADVANSMSVMFRIVEDGMPPIPEGCSELLDDFLSQCFHKDPSKRPSAEMLFEHKWLRKNWGAYKELRPQDSIPFLRRVSADLQRSEVARYFAPESPTSDPLTGTEDAMSGSPPKTRFSNGSGAPRMLADADPVSPREHTFVKTTFSKPMVCRVCLFNVKKSAVLCAQCSLIAHSKCAVNAPPTCDLRSQLLLYAQYAEKGNPSSAYANPLDGLSDAQAANIPSGPMSEVPYVAHTPRSSFDGPPPLSPPPQPTLDHPPTAFRFTNPFKRYRSPEPPSKSSTPVPPPKEEKPRGKKLRRNPPLKDRRGSVASNSTSPNTSSLRTEKSSARLSGNRQSVVSETGTDGQLSTMGDIDAPRSSRLVSISGTSLNAMDTDTPMPGQLPPDMRAQKKRDRDSKSSDRCSVQ